MWTRPDKFDVDVNLTFSVYGTKIVSRPEIHKLLISALDEGTITDKVWLLCLQVHDVTQVFP